MKKRVQRLLSLSYAPPILAALLFGVSLTLIKESFKGLSLPIFTFFWFLLRIPLTYPLDSKRGYTLKTSTLAFHLIFGFVLLGLYLSLFTAVKYLPLTNVCALFLMAPLYIPRFLRIWMGKKVDSGLWIGGTLAAIGALLSFNSRFGWNNIALTLALAAGALKGLHWVGIRRLRISESPFTLWFYESFTTLSGAALLLISSWESFKESYLLLLLLAAASERACQWTLNKASSSTSFQKGALFNLVIFLVLGADFLIFHSPPPIVPFFGALFIYFGLFLSFFQKNILPNPVYPL